MFGITNRQRQLLRCWIRFQRKHGFPPTLREIGSMMGIGSTNGVNDHLRSLERKGYIKTDGNMFSRGRRLTQKAMIEVGRGTTGWMQFPKRCSVCRAETYVDECWICETARGAA